MANKIKLDGEVKGALYVHIPGQLLRSVKELALKEGGTIQSITETALRRYLRHLAKQG